MRDTAECLRCGNCCRWLLFGVYELSDLDLQFIEARRLVVVAVEDGLYAVYAPNVDCTHLLPDNTCAVYDERPKSCRTYPEDDLVLIPGCGFAEDEDESESGN